MPHKRIDAKLTQESFESFLYIYFGSGRIYLKMN